MPVLSRAHTDAEHFEDQTLQIPVGSGPYRVAEVKPGERLVLERDPNYWANDLPISRGLYNFDEIRIDYYRDATAMFEAFKAGLIDYRVEDDTTRWRNEYDFPAAKDGRVIKAAIPSGLPKGVSGFAFNTRRPPFADPRVREALASMFDFEWINANLFGGAYKRSEGFFDDSELSSIGRPASERERALLAPLSRRGARRRDGGRMARAGLRRLGPRPRRSPSARSTSLRRAGYVAAATAGSSTRMARRSPSRSWSRTATRSASRWPTRAISRASASRRTCGSSTKCSSSAGARSFDFDMMIGSWIASPSPGNEQRGRWSSAAADAEGAYNIAGVRSPAVDAMIAAILAAETQRGFRRRGAGARPAADLRLLHRASLLCARAMDRLFGQARPSGQDAAVRRRPFRPGGGASPEGRAQPSPWLRRTGNSGRAPECNQDGNSNEANANRKRLNASKQRLNASKR